MKKNKEFFRGCLIGGAIGDALGWPVEFMRYNDILHRYGPDGIQDLQTAPVGKAEITDDTQMTLFTIEGILRAESQLVQNGICHPVSTVFHAYQRWLYTQNHHKMDAHERIYDGWLLGVQELHHRRAPGNSCLSALSSGELGSMKEPINNSKGCGGVMRVAPSGLFYSKDIAFERAADFAALTHGHPSGYLSAGALAYIIAAIIEGQDIDAAVVEAIGEIKKHEGHDECSCLLEKALELANTDISDIDAIHRLGEGWVGEEALAVSVYCSLKHRQDFRHALTAAVNHNGDSDSTGAITGNILGAWLGLSKIPEDWVKKIELSAIVTQAADDLLSGYQDTEDWHKRYPVFNDFNKSAEMR